MIEKQIRHRTPLKDADVAHALCVPCSHSCEHPFQRNPCVQTSLNAARKVRALRIFIIFFGPAVLRALVRPP